MGGFCGGQTAEGIYFHSWRTGLESPSNSAFSPTLLAAEVQHLDEAFPVGAEPHSAEAVND